MRASVLTKINTYFGTDFASSNLFVNGAKDYTVEYCAGKEYSLVPIPLL